MELHSIQTFSIFVVFTMFMSSVKSTTAAGCKVEELGIKVPNTRRIPDRHMTSSSDLSSRYPAFRSRIGLETKGSWGDAWCASESDVDPYIQVFFDFLTHITVIESEGVTLDGNKIWVKSYEVSTSNDSIRWTTYQEGNARELQANTGVQAANVSLNDTWLHYIRVNPKGHEGKWICIRIAMYGCQTGQDVRKLPTDVLNDAAFAKKPLKETLLLAIPIALFGCLLISGSMCLCRRYRARRLKKEKESSPNAQTKRGIDSGVVYEEPPPYESQMVAIDFGHDIQHGNEMHSQMPAFNESNKIFSFQRISAF